MEPELADRFLILNRALIRAMTDAQDRKDEVFIDHIEHITNEVNHTLLAAAEVCRSRRDTW